MPDKKSITEARTYTVWNNAYNKEGFKRLCLKQRGELWRQQELITYLERQVKILELKLAQYEKEMDDGTK